MIQQADSPKTAAKSVIQIVFTCGMIRKGQIQVCIRLNLKLERFLEIVSLICTEVFLWLILPILY